MSAIAVSAWPGSMETDYAAADDDELVRYSKRGETAAFSELVRRHQHNVYRLALRFMRDPVLAEDMSQEAFLKAFRLLKGFRGDSRFSTWLYRVTCSVCLTELNRQKKRSEVRLDLTHVGDAETGPAVPDDEAEIVRRCVTRLPEKYMTIVTLYYLQEASYEEIAGAMGIPLGTLKTWMHRARKELRSIVQSELNQHGPAVR